MLRDSTLRDGDDMPIDVVVTDLSTTGFLVDAALDLDVGATVRLGLGGAGTAAARIVRRENSTYGCQFIEPLSQDRVDAAFKYTEILASIGGSGDVGFAIDPDAEPDRWSGRARMALLLGAAGTAWAAVILAWHAI